MTHSHATRRAMIAGLAMAMIGGCSDPLGVHIVGTVTDASVTNAAAANALRLGALASVDAMTAGGTGNFDRGWVDVGLLADEWKTSGSQQQYGEIDIRAVPNTDVNLQALFANHSRARARAIEAIAALLKYQPTPAWGIGQMYIVLGLAEMQMSEYFCNGTPLSGQVNGVVVYGQPMTNAAVFALANAHLDTALTYLTATDATTLQHFRLAKLLKARVLLDLGGQSAAAAALVTDIPTSFAYQISFALATGDNAIWAANTSLKAATVGDSVDAVGRVANAIPFASANDPRVKTVGTSLAPSSQGFGSDGGTPLVVTTMWGRSDAINLVSGLDARLVEAEAALQGNNLAGMTSILNALRAAPPALTPSYTPAVMSALPVPATQAAGVTLFFREKAFWTFARGQRLGDMRRMIRQYSRTQDQVFPTGTFFKGGTYGADVNFDVSSLELNNPNFKACIDRSA